MHTNFVTLIFMFTSYNDVNITIALESMFKQKEQRLFASSVLLIIDVVQSLTITSESHSQYET